MSVRRALNFALAWFLGVVDPEEWKNEYRPIFERTFANQEFEREVRERLPQVEEGEIATFKVERSEPEEVVEKRSINFKTSS